MKGFITVLINDQFKVFELPKDPVTIGSGGEDQIQIPGAHLSPQHCELAWDRAASTWAVRPLGTFGQETPVSVNRSRVETRVYLQDQDLIELPDQVIRFNRNPDPAIYQGRESSEIPLGKAPLTIGRATEGEAENKVHLDAEDASISRNHVLIQLGSGGKNYTIADQSKAGSYLNGQPFKEETLIVGDRFRIGSYNFEFTGVSIKRVGNLIGGKVEARQLSVTVPGGKQILTKVSMDVERCSFVGILGGSGQGKSTLMNALCGINPATSGEVMINGSRLGKDTDMTNAGIGYVPQDDIVHRELTVTEAITYSARLRLDPRTPKSAIRELVEETIRRLGLEEHKEKRVDRLSGGQRKRVSIATELLAKPAVLFLDEPSSGLDPASEFNLMSLLRRLAATDCTVICTTHVLGRAYLFDQICFIQQGRLVFEGRPREALEHFGVGELDEVYIELDGSQKNGEDWENEFRERRQAPELESAIPPSQEDREEAVKARKPSYFGTFGTLLKRQWSITRADYLNLVFLIAQPLIIGLLVGWVADDVVLRMFLCVVATLWFGCSNGAQQIVRELPIFRRERVCGQSLHAYVQSKFLFLTGITAVQALFLLVVVILTAHIIHPRYDRERDVLGEEDESEYVQQWNYLVKHLREVLHPKAAEELTSLQALDGFAAVDDEGTAAEESSTRSSEADDDEEKKKKRKKGFPFDVQVIATLATVANFEDNVDFDRKDFYPEEKKPIQDQPEISEKEDRRRDREMRARMWGVVFTIFGLKILALLASAAVGVAIGLTISALVQTSTQAVMWVPLVLIPQILFGGFVVTRPDMSDSVRNFSPVVPSYAAQRIMDVSNVYYQKVPRLSNQSRVPVFLTVSGQQEEVRWEDEGDDRVREEQYDRVSPVNKSWQNLAVAVDRVGERLVEATYRRGVKKVDNTIEARADVTLEQGVLYRDLQPAWTALLMLLIWVGVCYFVTVYGLLKKQKGK